MQKYFITGQNALMVRGEPPTDEYDVVYYADDVDARIAELEKVLADIASMPGEDNEWDAVDKYHEVLRMAAAAFSRTTG